jgi:hypothetical protein
MRSRGYEGRSYSEARCEEVGRPDLSTGTMTLSACFGGSLARAGYASGQGRPDGRGQYASAAIYHAKAFGLIIPSKGRAVRQARPHRREAGRGSVPEAHLEPADERLPEYRRDPGRAGPARDVLGCPAKKEPSSA